MGDLGGRQERQIPKFSNNFINYSHCISIARHSSHYFKMKQKFSLILIFLIAHHSILLAQTETYTVTKAAFSSNKYDEFSPVFFKNGIVFCTSRNKNSFSNYSGIDNKGLFKMFYVDTIGKVSWSKSKIFSKSLTSKLNDGPATFNHLGDTIYFSRNMRTEGKLRELKGFGNNLGIFSAVFEGNNWGKISELRFNNQLYNFTTPYLSPDGSKLFFASDRPGGFGGSDIYYSQWKNGYWNEPVNLGSQINTIGNESYPFINEAGELFFSSDGHGGLGGKDIFVTKQKGSGWYRPVGLEAPVNSEFNDFGILTDALMNNGYFSSDRGKTIDIYKFKSLNFHFWFAEKQVENKYCFSFSDTGIIDVDNLKLQYEWRINNSSVINGPVASHCFPGPGKFRITLDLIDRRSGLVFFRKLDYGIEILNIEQPYINSPDIVIKGNPIELDGKMSYFQGYKIEKYYWDLGDSTYLEGESVNHRFMETSDFNVKMGIALRSLSTGKIVKRSVSKSIKVVENENELTIIDENNKDKYTDILSIPQNDNLKIVRYYSAEAEAVRESLFQVVILTSPRKTDLNNQKFRNIASKYSIREVFDPSDSLYYYVADQQVNLMSAYPAFSDLVGSGFRDSFVRLYTLKEPYEKELYYIVKTYGNLTDNYFDAGNRLTSAGYIMLDQVAMLMNKYPAIKLEVAVHTDDYGTIVYQQWLSSTRAQLIINYLTSRGINQKRLIARGFGGLRPIVSNLNPTNRRRNKRIEFTILY